MGFGKCFALRYELIYALEALRYFLEALPYSLKALSYSLKSLRYPLKSLPVFLLVFFISLLFSPLTTRDYRLSASELKKLGDLPLGAEVVDNTWTWEFRPGADYSGTGEVKPVTWIVVAKDHYSDGAVTLLSKEIVGRFTFDNSTDRGNDSGSNHWGDSGSTDASAGVRKFLNGSSYNYNEGYAKGYSGYEGAYGDLNSYEFSFYDAFSRNFKSLIVAYPIPCRSNHNYFSPYDLDDYFSIDNVFLPSRYELNFDDREGHDDEDVWPYFLNDSEVSAAAGLGGEYTFYWLRSTYTRYSHNLRGIDKRGNVAISRAANQLGGLRPVVNMDGDALVLSGVQDNNLFELYPDSVSVSLVPSNHTYILGSGQDLEFKLVKDDDSIELLKIRDDAGDLLIGSDYVKTGNQFYLKSEYIERKGPGSFRITFEMNKGFNPFIMLQVVSDKADAGQSSIVTDRDEIQALSSWGAIISVILRDEYGNRLNRLDSALSVVTDFGRIAVINEDNGDFNRWRFTADSAGKATITASLGADIIGSVQINVTDQIGQTGGFGCFSLLATNNQSMRYDQVAVIDNDNIIFTLLPHGTKLNSLIANFCLFPGASVTVNGVNQRSGVTPNDFSRPVVYSISDGSGWTRQYTVTATVRTAGDVDMSGRVNIVDAILILRHIVGLTDLKNDAGGTLYAGAYNRGRVSGADELIVSDAIYILRYVAGLIDFFPVEKQL